MEENKNIRALTKHFEYSSTRRYGAINILSSAAVVASISGQQSYNSQLILHLVWPFSRGVAIYVSSSTVVYGSTIE